MIMFVSLLLSEWQMTPSSSCESDNTGLWKCWGPNEKGNFKANQTKKNLIWHVDWTPLIHSSMPTTVLLSNDPNTHTHTPSSADCLCCFRAKYHAHITFSQLCLSVKSLNVSLAHWLFAALSYCVLIFTTSAHLKTMVIVVIVKHV